jgi:hypothetical protein
MFRKYWSVVLERAWRNTRHDFRLETNPRIFVAILNWCIVLYLAFESNRKEFSFVQATQNTAKWLAAISVLFPIWFLGRIFVSAADIYRELIDTNSSLAADNNLHAFDLTRMDQRNSMLTSNYQMSENRRSSETGPYRQGPWKDWNFPLHQGLFSQRPLRKLLRSDRSS